MGSSFVDREEVVVGWSVVVGWRKRTVREMRESWRLYREEMVGKAERGDRERLKSELGFTERVAKGVGSWLGTYGGPEEVLERYPAMGPFLGKPWPEEGTGDPGDPRWTRHRMPARIERWLPMVSIWARDRAKLRKPRFPGFLTERMLEKFRASLMEQVEKESPFREALRKGMGR